MVDTPGCIHGKYVMYIYIYKYIYIFMTKYSVNLATDWTKPVSHKSLTTRRCWSYRYSSVVFFIAAIAGRGFDEHCHH